MTDLDMFLQYCKERGMKDNSIYSYGVFIKMVMDAADKMGIDSDPRTMNEHKLRKIIVSMDRSSNTTNTLNTIYRLYCKYFGNEFKCKILTNNDVVNVKWIDDADFVQCIEKCESETDRIILHLGGNYGLRRAEIANLKTEDIHENYIRVYGKGHGNGKIRDVPTIDNDPVLIRYNRWRTEQITTAHIDRTDGRLVIYSIGGVVGGFTPASLGNHVRKFLKDHGIDATTHSLRREFITTSHRAGVDLVTIQRLVGHSDPKTTEMYIQNDKNMQIEALKRRNIYISQLTIP